MSLCVWQNNTFQCVLARSGNQSYAIYLYADGLIQWTASIDQGGINGSGGNAALVGYNAGDELTSFKVPGSQTDNILNIVSTSNIGFPGVWVFRLDEDDVIFPPCDDNLFGKITLKFMLIKSCVFIGHNIRTLVQS